jgi:hypothetical protein
MSRDALLSCGIALILVPTIVYGGLTLLGVLSHGAYGMPAPQNLTPVQMSLYRAGHAHAGVLLLLCLVLQLLLDHVSLPASWLWVTRLAALAAPLLVSAGFFGLAHLPALRALLYLGAASVVLATLTTGVGLLRAR